MVRAKARELILGLADDPTFGTVATFGYRTLLVAFLASLALPAGVATAAPRNDDFAEARTVRDFLAKGGRPTAEVDAMHQAWFKSVVLQVTLWSHPYVKNGDF